MYYALTLIGGVALGMIILSLLISGAREDEQAQHLIELQKEYDRGYRQAMFENGLATRDGHMECDHDET